MPKPTQQYLKEIFIYQNGDLYWKKLTSNLSRVKIGSKAGHLKKSDGYCRITINNKSYLVHRLIFLYHHNYLPKFIDHIDRNKSNNNIKNLRGVTKSQNLMNSKIRKGSSQYKGVSQHKSNKWQARIMYQGKRIYLGLFKNEIDAAKAYNDAIIKYHNKYGLLNEV